MKSEGEIRQQISHVIKDTHFEQSVGLKFEGKARDNYIIDDKRIMVATDRVSAFDRHLGCIPFKGEIVTSMTIFWFEATSDIVGNHLLEAPDPNVLVVKECQVLPVEMVVRAYITGVTPTSMWYQYQRGNRTFCGHKLPDGLRKNQHLPQPIITPSTKAPKGSFDESISSSDVLDRSLVSEQRFEQMSEVALTLFRRGAEIAQQHGIILVDTKYEFGIDKDGHLLLVDEVHTPDSSRFWYSDDYEKFFIAGEEQQEFDKEFIRIWLANQGFNGRGPVPQIPDDVFIEASSRYMKVFESITGQEFRSPVEDPIPRIRRALRSYTGLE